MDKKAKTKETPNRCVCGREAAELVFRGKKMISCPDPENCVGNLRTQWKSSKQEAIAEWNAIVTSFRYAKR